MSNTENTEQIGKVSQSLSEPEWVLSWRNERHVLGDALPTNEKYGIGISALTLAEETDFSSHAEYHVTPSKGLELYTWKEAVLQEEISVILERLFTSELFPASSSRSILFGQAFFRTGLVVYVQPTLDEAGNHKEETLQLETMLPLGTAADMIVVIAKEGARVKIESHLKEGQESSVFGRTIIVLTEGDSHVEIFSHASGARGTIFMENIALVAAHAHCDWIEDPNAPLAYRSRTISLLLGEEATSQILHTLIATANAQYDIWAGVTHHASNTHSHVYAIGLADDASKIIYRGMINMQSGVAQVDGAQEGKFLILSPKAEIDAIPELDIASKDVASSHKLSVSHIRDVDLFYAKTRGIKESEARELAIEGFFGSLLAKIKHTAMMEEISTRIHRLAKAD